MGDHVRPKAASGAGDEDAMLVSTSIIGTCLHPRRQCESSGHLGNQFVGRRPSFIVAEVLLVQLANRSTETGTLHTSFCTGWDGISKRSICLPVAVAMISLSHLTSSACPSLQSTCP
jgi:hypothetical protein